MNNEPYIKVEIKTFELRYNPEYGDDRICKCGHQYYRHFDSYENNSPVGCKYCECTDFEENVMICDYCGKPGAQDCGSGNFQCTECTEKANDKFTELSKKCPWRRQSKCLVLTKTFSGDYCKTENCGFFYWNNV